MSKESADPIFKENELFDLFEEVLQAGVLQISEKEERMLCSITFYELLGHKDAIKNLSKSFFF